MTPKNEEFINALAENPELIQSYSQIVDAIKLTEANAIAWVKEQIEKKNFVSNIDKEFVLAVLDGEKA